MSVAGKAAATAVTTDAVAVSLKGFISTANHALNRSSSPGGSSDSKVGDEAHTEACGGRATATIRLQKSYDGLNKPLAGKTVAIKDNILTNTSPQLPTTCDSKILGPNFCSPFNATVVELLGQAGCEVVGKTAMDEFGMGSHSIHTNFGEVYQEDSQGRKLSVGGSSGGSALAVKEGNCDFALGTDTGGSVRLPAAYTGVIGFKPSYGLLSRWGVIAYANSLDTVGILGREMSIVQQVFEILNQHDPKDPTSLSPATRSRLDRPVSSSRPLRIGIPTSYNVQELDPLVRHAWQQTIHHISTTTLNSPISIHPISLPRTKQALAAYYVLAPSEASSNLAKYDGVRYGSRVTNSSSWADDSNAGYLYAQTRSQGFGPEVQRRILLGTYSLSAAAMDNYFIQAQKVRRLVQQDFDNVFARPNPLHDHHSALQTTTQEGEAEAEEAKVDFIVCPTAPTPPPLLDDVKASEGKDPLQAYVNDVFTVPASLAGLPAISIPAVFGDRTAAANAKKEENERNIGIQIIGQFGSDRKVLDLARQIEESATK